MLVYVRACVPVYVRVNILQSHVHYSSPLFQSLQVFFYRIYIAVKKRRKTTPFVCRSWATFWPDFVSFDIQISFMWTMPRVFKVHKPLINKVWVAHTFRYSDCIQLASHLRSNYAPMFHLHLNHISVNGNWIQTRWGKYSRYGSRLPYVIQ